MGDEPKTSSTAGSDGARLIDPGVARDGAIPDPDRRGILLDFAASGLSSADRFRAGLPDACPFDGDKGATARVGSRDLAGVLRAVFGWVSTLHSAQDQVDLRCPGVLRLSAAAEMLLGVRLGV